MNNFYKNEKLPIKIFIMGSFSALILFVALLIFLNSGLPATDTTYGSDKYFFNKDAGNNDNNDPLMTRVPSLKDVLAGPIISDLDPSIGPKDAKVNIVVFSDADCGFCLEQEAVLKKILDVYPDQVRLIRKDFPDTKKTSFSWQSAIAGRCAD
jgi:protein-disulfide isomerase